MNNNDFYSFLDQLENKRLYEETKLDKVELKYHPIFNKTNAVIALGVPYYRVLKIFNVDSSLYVQYLDGNDKKMVKLTLHQLINAMAKSRRGKAKDILITKVDDNIYLAENKSNGNTYELYYDKHHEYCSCADFHNTNTALKTIIPHSTDIIYCKHLMAFFQQFKPFFE